jgi:3-hydroxyacyl-CoA dehydrogenase/enoyl-CoA hydratase/3-hydroxybutyryl-CoA epimerase
VHVVGAGVMGGDIAAWCAFRGLRVTLQDQTPERIAPALKRAAELFKSKFKQVRDIQAAMDRLIPDVKGEGVLQADLVIEAIFENLEAKQQLFKKIESKLKPGALMATNTSSIPLEKIGEGLQHPEKLIGLHFFNPVAKMMLVEIVIGKATNRDLVKNAAAFVRQIDKLPLPVKSAPGFLVNRILVPYMMEAINMATEGIALETIDEAALQFGMPMGPIELVDTVGLDISLAVGKMLSDPDSPAAKKLEELVKAGRLGRKTGQGFYKYKNGKVVKYAPGKVDQQLVDRLIQPLLIEAEDCLQEKIVDDADLLDAGVIFGTGFAPFRGGPMHYLSKK